MKADPKQPRQAIGYVRGLVSHPGQKNAGPSLKAQEQAVAKAAAAHGLKLVEIHRDEAGAADAHPGLAQALEQAAACRGVLVVQSLGCLARSAQACIRVAEQLHRHKTDLIVVDEKLDTTVAGGEMFFALMRSLGELELERYKLARQAPYGFEVADDGEHLILNPTEQEVIRRILQHHRQGWDAARIAGQLNSEKIAAKAGGSWEAATIQEMIDRTATSRWAYLQEEA